MNKVKFTAIVLAAILGCGMLTGCSVKMEDSSQTDASSAETATEAETTRMDVDSYNDHVLDDIKTAERSDEPLEFAPLGDTITPDANDIDGDLGSYRESVRGTKLYFDEKEFPPELMETLEQYFISFAENDYTMYTRCAYPDYLDKMEVFLSKEHGYDLKTSFASQCSNLATTTNGSFKVTRLKMDAAPQYDESKDNLTAYFERFKDILGDGYYDKLKKEVDNIYDGEFFVMAENRLGTEQMLISAYEIVFVEKDGRFYVFG